MTGAQWLEPWPGSSSWLSSKTLYSLFQLLKLHLRSFSRSFTTLDELLLQD